MPFHEYELDLKNRVQELEEKIQKREERKEEIIQELEGIDPDEDLPEDLEEEWEDLNKEIRKLKGDKKKFLEASVIYTDENEVVSKASKNCSESEVSIEDIDEERLKELFSQANLTVFTASELSYGQVQGIRDDMVEQSFDVDIENEDVDGTPKQGFYEQAVIKEALDSWPPKAPTDRRNRGQLPAPGNYPIAVSEWLYEEIDERNTFGDVDLGNSSLEEELRSRR